MRGKRKRKTSQPPHDASHHFAPQSFSHTIAPPNSEKIMETMSLKKMEYSLRKVDRPYTKKYRIYFEQHPQQTHDDDDDEGKCPIPPRVATTTTSKIPISPFHDIPLYHDKQKGILNMVVEIPRWSQAKFEISRTKRLNPIIQDELHGHPRFVKNCFPYKGYIWNYGALPQTWEDPSHVDPQTHTKGDNDPLDACEISPQAVTCTGTIKRVKPLGILCLIDSGETDWKVIVIDVTNPLASKLHDIDDVDRHFPGLLDATRDWFRYYKVPDGNGNKPNEFGYGGRFLDKQFAEKIIGECAGAWETLIQGEAERGDVSIANTTLKGTPGKLDPDEVGLPPGEDLSPAPIEQDIDEWVFLDKDKLDSNESALRSLCGMSSLHIELKLDK